MITVAQRLDRETISSKRGHGSLLHSCCLNEAYRKIASVATTRATGDKNATAPKLFLVWGDGPGVGEPGGLHVALRAATPFHCGPD